MCFWGEPKTRYYYKEEIVPPRRHHHHGHHHHHHHSPRASYTSVMRESYQTSPRVSGSHYRPPPGGTVVYERTRY
ncbi:hypothetical protein X797_004034 [Metarhizium robertsii]|uniref:Uncharacterized protein n=1 Tax=Metarhizium robertsii TaxID=568076 RepID=A0A0A1UY06_9HYPO|nr:hypothetical protein X797_004034 [Metarhizium robertsii]